MPNNFKTIAIGSYDTSYRDSMDMEVPLEKDELRLLSEKQKEPRIHTGGFKASAGAESVSGLLESDTSVPFDHVEAGYMQK